ncbi:MAG TPA: aldo/keto reductase [Phycisphaerae bacterium]|nr:aldo/keto reductase [Phycisphaerae bacterium]
MQYGSVPGVDKPISRLVQGLIMVSTKKLDESFALLDEVFETGVNTFDSAHIYGGGDSERVLGRWMEARGLREKVVILTKGAHLNQDRERVTPFDITSDLYDSLARLKTDYIDLYVLHRDDPKVPVGPIVEILDEHLQAGRVRAFGGSNWSHERLQEANEYAAAKGLTGFAVSSPNFSLAEELEPAWKGCISLTGEQGRAARQWYAKTQMPLFTWSSLARGFFTGRYRRDNLESLTSSSDKLNIRCYASEANFTRLDRVMELAKEKHLSGSQIALAYVMNQPLNIFALVGCEKGQESRENAQALEVKFTNKEIAYLELRADTR